MRITKKVTSIVLAVLMVVSMMSVMAISASAATAQVVEEGAENANVMYTNAAGTTVTYYDQFPTLSDGTYKVLKSFTQTFRAATGTFGANYEIDLNKQTVTFDIPDDGFSFGIKHRGGTATIKNGTIVFPDNADDDRAIEVNGGTFNIKSNVTINCAGDVSPVVVTKGTLNTAGKLNATDSFAIATHGTQSKNYTINVTGGTVKSTNASAIYMCGTNGTLNISGGTIEGTTGVYIKTGTTNITGGTIKGTREARDYSYNGSGANSTGDAVVVDNCGYPGGEPDVNISGGTFTSTNAQPVASYAYGTDNEPIDSFISGGTFKSTNDTVDSVAFDELCVDGFSPTVTTGGVKVEDDCEASVDGVKYATFAEAVTAADNAKLITTLKKAANPYTMSVGQTIIVDNYSNVTLLAPAGAYAIHRAYDSVEKTYTYTVVNAVASLTKSDSTVTYYDSFSSAWNYATTGSTVTLLQDTTDNWVGKRAYDFNVELGGHSITLSSPRTYTWLIYGKNTISNGTINFTGADVESGFYIQDAKGELTLDNVTVTGTGNISPVYITKGKVTVDDGSTITSENTWAIATNGSSGNGSYTINVKDGATITATNSPAIYQANSGTLNVEGGTITGTEAIYIKSGTTNITGGTFTATGAKAGYTYNGNGCNPTGDAIVIDNCKYPGGAPTVSVTGGTFISENAEAVASYAGAKAGDEAPDAINNFISGGNFSSDVSDLVVDGKMADNVGAGVEGAPFTITLDTNPLNPLNTAAADINDGNLFGLECKYLKGTLLGVQTKAHHDAVTSENGEQEAAEGNDLRFVAVLDYNLLKDADDYGFVLAKVENTKTTTNTNFNGLQVGRGAGEKFISAKGTYNTVCGDDDESMAYGNPADGSTDYKYVTCAVNGIDDASKIAIRFYYKKDGVVYYAKYAGHNYQYTGCTAGINASGNIY